LQVDGGLTVASATVGLGGLSVAGPFSLAGNLTVPTGYLQVGTGISAPANGVGVQGGLSVGGNLTLNGSVTGTLIATAETVTGNLGVNGNAVVANLNVGSSATVGGNLNVTGAITAGTKDFKIDDPLDPEHKDLYHASIESSEMKNMYDGVATLDTRGEAVVELPDWFEALNRDFRYQLTAVGAPGPNLYIKEKVRNNRFRIGGGEPGAEVSWQVTGVRHDAWANAHPLQVEQEKSLAERGHD